MKCRPCSQQNHMSNDCCINVIIILEKNGNTTSTEYKYRLSINQSAISTACFIAGKVTWNRQLTKDLFTSIYV